MTEYIDENSKLLSALGLFLGLSVFANNLPDKGIARFLSFLLFTLGLLVFFELMRNFAAFDWYGRINQFAGNHISSQSSMNDFSLTSA